jgi:uncharacterized SAM-binding protein YcdF (DUF218 family)
VGDSALLRQPQSAALKLLGGIALLFFFSSVFTPLPNLLASWFAIPPRLGPAEAIVVLGAGGVSSDGALSNTSLRRALHGIILHRNGLAPLLVFSGSPRRKPKSEVEARAELAHELGVPSDAILTIFSHTTREEATQAAALLHPRNIRKILLVTDSLHMSRAQRLFEQAGFEVLAASADDFSNAAESPEGRLELMRRTFEEILARLYYRLARYL